MPCSEAARSLIGSHDFSALRAAECQARSPMRDLTRLEVRRIGEFVLLEVTANAFLHHMVRNIAGLLIHIGQGEAGPRICRRGVGWARPPSRARHGAGQLACTCGASTIRRFSACRTIPISCRLPPAVRPIY